MLAHSLDDLPIVIEMTKTRVLASELVSIVQAQGVSVVCDAGATLVASTLAETRTYLDGLVEIPRIPAPEPDGGSP